MSRAYWPKAEQEEVMYEHFLPFDDYRIASRDWQAFRDSELPNLNLLDRQPVLNNFDPLLVGHFAEYINRVERSNGTARHNLLLAAGVDGQYYLDGIFREWEEPAGFEALFMQSVCWHSDEKLIPYALLDPDWIPWRQVHLIGPGDCPPLPLPPASHDIGSIVQSVEMTQSPNQVTIQVQTTTGGLVYIPRTDYPGWQAFVDGKPARILRANLAFMAVEVPAGANAVRLEYRPWWLLPGTFISLLSLLLLLIVFRSRNPGQEG